jgi:hypothetical protein
MTPPSVAVGLDFYSSWLMPRALDDAAHAASAFFAGGAQSLTQSLTQSLNKRRGLPHKILIVKQLRVDIQTTYIEVYFRWQAVQVKRQETVRIIAMH